MLLRGGLKANTTAFEIIGPVDSPALGQPQIDGRDVIPPADGWQEHAFVRLAATDGAG